MPDRRSRFTVDLDPEAPLPEHPRPQLRRPDWINLNGWWDLAIVGVDGPRPDAFDEQVLVPFGIGSELSGVSRPVTADERVWMRRRFPIDPTELDGRLRLHFGAVDWECTIWCNGREVGSHRGGYDPFWVDLTDALRADGDQELVLSIWDPTTDGPQPVGKQSLTPAFIWYPAVAGVWQTVWLEPVPSACVESVVAVASLVEQSVTVRVAVSGARAGYEVAVRAVVDGGVVAAGGGVVTEGEATVSLKIEDLWPWSPADPFLYDLDVSLVRTGAVVDRVESYFGAREVGVARDRDGVWRLTLNGESVFHLGLLDQGWWPDGLYTAPTDQALAFDIEATKAMGFNTIRKHVKVEPARWYWHADRLGVLVWQDMPSTRVDVAEMGRQIVAGVEPGDMDWSIVAPAGDPDGFRRELDRMLAWLAPFPCVVMWVPFNEGWGQHDTGAVVDHVMSRDPTRLVDGPSGWVDAGEGHVRDHHTYFSEHEFPGVDDGRPVVYGEYGGYKVDIAGHSITQHHFGYGDNLTSEQFVDAYRRLTATLAELVGQGLAGAIYTQTTDVEGEINGLLTYDREVFKIAPERLREIHRPLTGPG